MGDLSSEPSMEEILSSIKRIIAEEGEAGPARPRRQPRAQPPRAEPDEVLELSDPMPVATPPAAPDPVAEEARAPEPRAPEPTRDAPIVSNRTAEAARGALGQLSRLLVKPEPESDGTLEGLVRDMLRPMLRDWLDANLPAVVETMVAREIGKITGQSR